ncbi:glutamate--cysteine ligase [Georgenia subflava]|uniref:Putative glutamate--cysteine ligase 2 n=1 Tax=Georgenia subflava TaxID=1622177 RepID=A0A6N7EIY1_9MICO|nr:glutamate--cysteine ligase [Georgenia subflava]MPV36978.1 YbdK family carboxylate-amine ligase [Georgenia subflava]
MRTVGVEEELLLVESGSGRALSVAGRVLARAAATAAEIAEAGATASVGAGAPTAESPGGILDKELQQQQIETDTRPHTELGALEDELRGWRRTAIDAARQVGARVAALATCPLPVEPRAVATPRYRAMTEHFGLTATENLTCGCHVHVAVDSHEEAVAVLDRIRVRLPLLLALSANSPFWQGQDSSYDSYRSQLQVRWPTAGPTEIFGSAEVYDAMVADLVATGVPLDTAMVYFDARASHRYPTVEIRAADVCLDAADAVLVAALGRALVETAAREWAAGEPPAPVPAAMLRVAMWQAARDGVSGQLLEPLTGRPRPAGQVLADLVAYLRPALAVFGDEELVTERVDAVLTRGNGASRQREVLSRTGQLADVVAHSVRVTAGQEG